MKEHLIALDSPQWRYYRLRKHEGTFDSPGITTVADRGGSYISASVVPHRGCDLRGSGKKSVVVEIQ